MKDERVFDLYKPFRNFLRKANLMKSLAGIHGHSNFQDFNKKLPGYINGLPFGYTTFDTFFDFMRFGITPWELHTLAKEVIINGQIIGGKRTMENWNYLSDSMNKLKYFLNEVYKIYGSTDNVLFEIHRLSHREFKWQRKASIEEIGKYWTLYKNPELEKIIQKAIGISIEDIYLIGFALTGFYLKHFALDYPPNIYINDINSDKLTKFLNHFSKDYPTLRSILIQEQEYNEKYEYAFNSLHKYPIMQINHYEKDYLVCPIPRLLFERLSSGIYYEICGEERFDLAFGNSFQNLVGTMLKKLCSKSKIYSEETYNKGQNKTIDWILEDTSSTLFIECKTKRLTLGAKIELLNKDELNREYEKLASFLTQTYLNILNYEQNKFPHYKFDSKRKIYPIVVTLEEWFFFGDTLFKLLQEKLIEKFKILNIPVTLLEKYPYSICSLDDFEMLLLVGSQIGMDTILKEKIKTHEEKMWNLRNFIFDKYGEYIKQYKNIFTEDLNKFLDSKTKENNSNLKTR